MDTMLRHNQLSQLETYLKAVDIEVTMILQSLQWDRKHLMEKSPMKTCHYDINHKVPPDKLEEHEKLCFLKSQGYTDKDRLLPSPIDQESKTLVRFDSNNIVEIINNASRCQASFETVLIAPFGCDKHISFCILLEGPGCSGTQPLTLDRLQATYTADERRAIYDEVVKQVPSCHDLSDLALLTSNDGESKDKKPKSKLEILAELRDMKRRRTKYRVAPKTRNYSDVLRDVIHTQMEMYTKAQKDVVDPVKKETAGGSGEAQDLRRSNDEDSLKHQNVTNPSRTHNRNEENHFKRTKSNHNESQQFRHNREYDRRKRNDDSTDRQRQAKYTKITESDRPRGYQTFYSKDIEHSSSHVTKYDNTKSNRRDDRYVDSSSFDRDCRERYDQYERRKSRPEKDRINKKKIKTESRMPAPKDVKTEECHSSEDERKRSNQSSQRNDNDSKEMRQESDQNKIQKTRDNVEETFTPITIKEEKNAPYDRDDESYSSDDNQTDYTETSRSYKRAKDTRFGGPKVHYSNVKTDRDAGENSDYKSERFRHQERVEMEKEEDIVEKESNTSYGTAGYRVDSNRYSEKFRHNQLKKDNCHRQEEYWDSREDVKKEQSLNRSMSNGHHHNRSAKDKHRDSDRRYQMTYKQRSASNTQNDSSRMRSRERSYSGPRTKEKNRYGEKY